MGEYGGELEVGPERGRGGGVNPQPGVCGCEPPELGAEGLLPQAGHLLHQLAAGLQVVGELQRPGRAHTLPSASSPLSSHRPPWAPALHAAQLVADVGSPSVRQLGDGIVQDRQGAVGGPGRLDFLHGPDDVIDDAAILVVWEAEVGEGVVEAAEAGGGKRHLHLVDVPVQLRGDKDVSVMNCKVSVNNTQRRAGVHLHVVTIVLSASPPFL